METMTAHLQEIMNYGISFVLLLGILIFVHELGHFLVAKYFKVRVETFSLGFGKKILQFKRGDTTYCLSLIPLGGYVKMYGDDPTADVPKEEQKWSFLHKPVGQRVAVVLAGPLMNFFFAIFVFAVVAMVGEKVLGPQVGDIDPSTAAGKAGFQSGDVIKAVGARTVQTWEEINSAISEFANQNTSIKVERNNQAVEIPVQPVLTENDSLLSLNTHQGKIDGLSNMSLATVVGVSRPTSPAGASGLQTGDIIVAINDKAVNYWRDLPQTFMSALGNHEEVNLSVRRKNATANQPPVKLTLVAPLQPVNKDNVLDVLGIEKTDLFLNSVLTGSPAQTAGLQANDRVVSLNGKGVANWEELVKEISAYKAKQPPIQFKIVREGQEKEIIVTPKLNKMPTAEGGEEERYTVGIQPLTTFAPPQVVVERTSSPIKALMVGCEKAYYWSQVTVLTFVRIFQNKISSKNLGGIISIASIAKTTFEMGLSEFLRVMGLISINLFILNLLPIPVLDGGHLVFFSIEALKGAPLSMRKMEIAQQIGLVIILALMVFSLFNDFSRIAGF